MQLNRKRLIEQSVIVRVVDRSQQLLNSFAAINLQQLSSSLRLWRPLQAKQQRCQTATMIEMQMTNPDGVEVGPIEILCRHSVCGVGAAIKQNGPAFRRQPESSRRALRMRH